MPPSITLAMQDAGFRLQRFSFVFRTVGWLVYSRDCGAKGTKKGRSIGHDGQALAYFVRLG